MFSNRTAYDKLYCNIFVEIYMLEKKLGLIAAASILHVNTEGFPLLL